ncbi:S-adenosylmethionine decarboxylase [Cognatiyoonia koreensis]|uniref:S-adenosylmethionine decarboxylase n=1 Tax=Cognatiyoonia koreensis TaxID=364200 RepID=A0A1I0RNC0_9RHOB|nr:adenosylmethionine decarboxylase [Cognatiyoonia koreensis]SEW42601.1 S-adenosylmethionine decarboxylase [Cognatiyoonia koreensis]
MNVQSKTNLTPGPLGQHVIVEFHGATHLTESAETASVLRDAARAAGAVVLDVKLHDFGMRHGYTGVALLAESHISIHTWPEHGYAAVDIFMCGDAEPLKSLAVLRAFFAPSAERVTTLKRGEMVLEEAMGE